MTPIERLKEFVKELDERSAPFTWTEKLHGIIHALENPWIKTSERLPEVDQSVNFWITKNECDLEPRVAHGVYTQWDNVGMVFVTDDGEGYTEDFVTHWHPLPKDPE